VTLFVLHCTEVYYVYYTGGVIRYFGINRWARVLKMNCWAVGQLLQSSSSIPNMCCCTIQSSSFTSGWIIGGKSVVAIRAMLVVQREMGD